jgi:MFS family permease
MSDSILTARSGQRFIVGTVSGGHLLSHFYILAFPPLFPLLRDEFALSNTELGLIVSVMMFPIMALQLPVGQLVDRIGAKLVFVVGVGLTAAATLLAGLAPTYLVVLVLAFVAGVGQSCFHPSDYALLSAVVGSENEGKGFSIHTFGGYAGFAAAPVVIGGIGVRAGWRAALLAAGGVGLLYAVFAFLTMDTVYLDQLDDTAAESSESFLSGLRSLLSPTLTGIFLFFMFLFMAGTGIQSFTTVFLVSGYGLPETIGNSALTVFFTLSALGVLAGGPIADRYDIHGITVLALLAAGAMTAVLALRVLPLTAVVALGSFAVIGVLSGVMRPARDRLVSTHSPDDSSGRSFGFVFSGGSLGGFISPILLGFAIDTLAIEVSFLLIGVFFVSCAAIVGLIGARGLLAAPRLAGDSDPKR